MMCGEVEEIVLDRVNFSYGENNLYEDGISAKLKKGNVYLLSGRNGCGKSTLVNILMKTWREFEGDIRMDGKSIRDMSREEVIAKIGLSFQKTPIFHDTVRNNISLGKKGSVEELLPLLEFENDLRIMDRDLDSWLKDTSSLSGGQAQKVGILRTLFSSKPVYVFDESTANLDYKSKEAFFQLIDQLKRDHIILLISHEEDVWQHVDEVIEIKGGAGICM